MRTTTGSRARRKMAFSPSRMSVAPSAHWPVAWHASSRVAKASAEVNGLARLGPFIRVQSQR